MRVYRVVADRDGKVTKVPGEVTTEIIRDEFIYAANEMTEVWNHIDWIRNDPDYTLIAIIETHPAISIIE